MEIAAPGPSEVEFSILGPGFGETVLIHLGNSKWIVVDSCVDFTGEPIALQYFRNIRVEPTSAVSLVVATHWHDDHIKGLGRLFRACKSAEFACSSALSSKEFLVLVEAYRASASDVKKRSSLNEFCEIVEEVRTRAGVRGEKAPPVFALENCLLWQDPSTAWKVFSLSPSSGSLLRSSLEISNYVRSLTGPKRSLVLKSHNHFSVVLWVTNGEIHLLLGADLEETGDPFVGWSAIVSSKKRPPGKATAFKVPHHGSLSGHHDKVWEDMLSPNPVSALTPWVRGGDYLPKTADIDRILTRTRLGFATAPPSSRKPAKKRPSEVEKLIRRKIKFVKEVNYLKGHVRARTSLDKDAPWEISLFGDALPLSKLQI